MSLRDAMLAFLSLAAASHADGYAAIVASISLMPPLPIFSPLHLPPLCY